MSIRSYLTLLAIWSLMTMATVSTAISDEEEHIDVPYSAYGHGGVVTEKERAFTHPGEVGKGVGPYAEYWEPIPMHRYWAPQYFYTPPEEPQGVFNRGACVGCHGPIQPPLVKAWSTSAHGDFSNLNPYQREKLREIERLLGRSLTDVSCIDCHGEPGAEEISHDTQLIMPGPDTCAVCHPKETDDFLSEKDYGIPDWPEGRESHALSYDANLWTDIWAATDKNIVQGCDMCHNIQHKCDSCHTRHSFKASEARKPEACATCHNGPDHPDIEYYLNSKHGTIYTTEGDTWDWSKPLKDAEYPSPTCQSCHMHYEGDYSHNMVRKAIMGEGDVLFYNNLFTGVPPSKYISENEVFTERRRAWIQTCSQCHSTRFSRDYLTSMDKASDAVFNYLMDAFAILKDVYEKEALYPMPEDRPKAPKPVEESWPDTLGGFYGEFWAKDGNPSRIERDFLYMWENEAFCVRKGLAHQNPNGFTYISWANLLKKYIGIQSESTMLLRMKELERKRVLIMKPYKAE
ncbi:MAG: multiheme c-type cytochrome [Candidatus Brocadiales bacterium]